LKKALEKSGDRLAEQLNAQPAGIPAGCFVCNISLVFLQGILKAHSITW
jgi:hypothetical protein